MPEPASTNSAIKELIKDPLSYVIAFIIGTGGYLMKGSPVGATWVVGIGLIGIGVVSFIAKFLLSILDGSFKRKYTDIISAQGKAMKNQTSVINELSKNSIAAHTNMNAPTQLSGGYARDGESVTSTGKGSN